MWLSPENRVRILVVSNGVSLLASREQPNRVSFSAFGAEDRVSITQVDKGRPAEGRDRVRVNSPRGAVGTTGRRPTPRCYPIEYVTSSRTPLYQSPPPLCEPRRIESVTVIEPVAFVTEKLAPSTVSTI